MTDTEDKQNNEEATQYLKFLPELLDDSTPSAKQIMKTIDDVVNERIVEPKIDFKIDVKKYLIENFIKGTFKQDPIIKVLNISEIIHTSLMVPFFKTKKEDRKIYVIQKDFFSKFKELDLAELCFKHLPKSLTGYIELPEVIYDNEGMEIKGFFFYIGNVKDAINPLWRPNQLKPYPVSDSIVGFSYSDPTMAINAFSWTHIPVDENIKIMESYKEVKRVTADFSGETHEITHDYPKYLAIMYNLLTYLNTGEPDIRTFRNKLRYQSPTSKKPIKADKHLSNANIVQVGFSYKKERLHHTDEWYVLPFMRWQRCGVGLSDVKLVYVRGHTKKRTNT